MLWQKIKKIFKTEKTIIDKINILINIELPVKKIYGIKINTYCNNIFQYLEYLEYIINFDINNSRYTNNVINPMIYKDIYFIDWICNINKCYSTNGNDIKTLLKKLLILYSIYNTNKNITNDIYITTNMSILKNHLILIEKLIDLLYSIYASELE